MKHGSHGWGKTVVFEDDDENVDDYEGAVVNLGDLMEVPR